MLLSGIGTAKDDERAARVYTKACDAGAGTSCYVLGLMCTRGVGVDKDPLRAEALFRRSCDGGEQDGCAELASLVRALNP